MTKIDLKPLEEQCVKENINRGNFLKNHKKKIIVLFGISVILIGVTIKNLEVLNPPSDVRIIKVQQPAEKPSRHAADMQFLAGILLGTKNWAIQPVRSFIMQWNKLELHEKNSAKQLIWYQKFSTGLKDQITRQRVLINSRDDQAIRRETELLALAESLGLSIYSLESIHRDDKTPSLLAQITTQDQDLTKLTSLKLKPKEALREIQNSHASTVNNQNTTTPQNIGLTKLNTEKISDISPSGQEVNKADLEDIIEKYIAAFENGQTSKVINLFATDKYSSREKPLTEIADEIEHMINSTVSRKIDVGAMKWVNNNRMVIGEGSYTSILNPLENETKQQLTAHIQLTLRQVLNQTLITNFKVSGQTIVDIGQPKKAQHKLAKRDIRQEPNHKSSAVNAKSVYPTRAELQDLIVRYVKTYHDGGIDKNTTRKGKILIVAERNQEHVRFKNLFHIINED